MPDTQSTSSALQAVIFKRVVYEQVMEEFNKVLGIDPPSGQSEQPTEAEVL